MLKITAFRIVDLYPSSGERIGDTYSVSPVILFIVRHAQNPLEPIYTNADSVPTKKKTMAQSNERIPHY
jgi:hypothetical protein